MTIKCPQCNYQNPEDADYCEQCGANLAVPVPAIAGAAGSSPATVASPVGNAVGPMVGGGSKMTCPSCNAPIASGDEFCFNCGTDVRPLTGEQPIVPAPVAATPLAANSPTPAPAADPEPEPEPDPNHMPDDAINKALAEIDGVPATPAAPAAPELTPVNAFSAPPPPPAPAPVAPPQLEKLVLQIAGPQGEEIVEWKGRELLLGRNDPKTRIFPDVNLDDSASSRRHLSVWHEQGEGQFYAQDLESANGTLINDRDMKPGEPTLLHNGDVLKIGTRYVIQVQLS